MARPHQISTAFELPSRIFVDNCDEGRWENHRPLTQRELRATAALGSVLDRRAWWIKWTQRPSLRAAWLAEIEAELVRATVTQLVDGWASSEHYAVSCSELRDLCHDPSNLAGEISRALRDVIYPPPEDYPFDDGNNFESDGEGQDDEEEALDDLDGNRFEKKTSNRQKEANPFLQILWYAKMEVARDRLRESPPHNWSPEWLYGTLEQIDIGARDTTLRRVYSLIEATRDQETKIMAHTLVREYFPEERREQVRELLALHLRRIRRSVAKTLHEVETMLQVTIDTLNLGSDKSIGRATRVFYVPGPVRRTWLSDNTVPPRLKATLLSKFAQLADAARRNGNRDPESPVYRLLDPTLHCVAVGETNVIGVRVGGGTVATRMRDIVFADTSSVLEVKGHPTRPPCEESAEYVRLPSEIDVNHDGTRAAFRSYINNLHPEDHAPLYKSLASLFVRFVPLFDQVVSALDSSSYDVEDKYIVEPMLGAALDGACPSSSLRRLVPPGLLEATHPRFTLKGSRCQVIVQVDEIILTPSESAYAGEPWQIDGIDAERIVATGVYCASCENITEPQYSFRVPVAKPPFDTWDSVAVDIVYQLHDGDPLHQGIGHVTLKEDRCIVYPSIYEHRMHDLRLIDTTKSGSCTIVKFMLVDPVLRRVVSTETIPPQQNVWLKRELDRILTAAALTELIVSHILSFIRLGQTHEQGLDVRRKLLEDRAGIVDKRVEDRVYHYTN